MPYAFTEQGVAMLSSVLNSDKAININIQIRTIIDQGEKAVYVKTIYLLYHVSPLPENEVSLTMVYA